MADGINTDKVVVNAGGGGSGLDAAAMIAALGNRNEGSDNAALIAALGNRNSELGPAMMAMMNNCRPGMDGYGFGGGINGILAIAALGLIFGRGRGGLFGGDGDGGGNGAETRLQSNADTLALLTAVGNTKDAVTGGFATTALALSQGFANVKDSQQASTFLLSQQLNTVNQNVSEQGCSTRETVLAAQTAILSALKDNRISELEDRVRVLDVQGRGRETEISVNQTVAQAQQQQQQQFQINDRFARLEAILGNVIQVAHATNQNVIAGNSGPVATGAQTANPTNVNTRS